MSFKRFNKNPKTISMSLTKSKTRPRGVLTITFSKSMESDIPDYMDLFFGTGTDFGMFKLVAGIESPQTRKMHKLGTRNAGSISVFGLTDHECTSVRQIPCEYEFCSEEKSYTIVIPKAIIDWLNIPDEVDDVTDD